MKAIIKTDGFCFNTAETFGCSLKEWIADSFTLTEEGGLEINSHSGVYLFPTVVTVEGTITVPPCEGTYSGPSRGLGGIYGLDFHITAVRDIVSSLAPGKVLSSAEYGEIRSRSGTDRGDYVPYFLDSFDPREDEWQRIEEGLLTA